MDNQHERQSECEKEEQRSRCIYVIKSGMLILCIGILYALWCAATGLGIPCPFHALTGFYCPGCGFTRMMQSLLQFDLAGAWRIQPAIFVSIPFLAVVMLQTVRNYVKTGKKTFSHRQNLILYGAIFVLTGYCIYRNVVKLGGF